MIRKNTIRKERNRFAYHLDLTSLKKDVQNEAIEAAKSTKRSKIPKTKTVNKSSYINDTHKE